MSLFWTNYDVRCRCDTHYYPAQPHGMYVPCNNVPVVPLQIVAGHWALASWCALCLRPRATCTMDCLELIFLSLYRWLQRIRLFTCTYWMLDIVRDRPKNKHHASIWLTHIGLMMIWTELWSSSRWQQRSASLWHLVVKLPRRQTSSMPIKRLRVVLFCSS